MIAIAGSKGGCGKSTVALGLAAAFAGTETPAVTIDADRQLPNLHVMADCDREPTVADLARESESGPGLREVAQQHPREPNVGIVPAPTSSQAFEFDAIDEVVDIDGVQVLVDCPSGAGPDVVEPLEQAEGAIVVASNADRSLEAAETTIDMARRLDVPIYGAILNKCAEVPPRATRWDGVPILGCVPERPSPLVNDEVAAAFDDIVAQLRTQSPTDRAPPAYAGDRLPLGTDAIDRRLGGGLPAGSVVALVADPASQAEQLLYRATGTRGTLYLSTEQTRTTVQRALESVAAESGTPTIRRVAGDDALEEATSLIGKLPSAANLVVDPVDELERRDRAAYVSFLETLAVRTSETDGLAILHCHDPRDRDAPANRAATLRAVDAVFELETVAPDDESDVERSLAVPKYRPDAGVGEPIPLEFGRDRNAGPIESPPGSD